MKNKPDQKGKEDLYSPNQVYQINYNDLHMLGS